MPLSGFQERHMPENDLRKYNDLMKVLTTNICLQYSPNAEL